MRIRYADEKLKRFVDGIRTSCGHGPAIDKAVLIRIQQLAAATSEQDIRALKSLRYEKLKGNRQHQRSIRLNDQWRLILELDQEAGQTVIVIIGVEDYH